MELTHGDICLFCMKKAQEEYSSHGHCFDGYYCNCEGYKNYTKIKQEMNNKLTQATQICWKNKAKLEKAQKRQKLKAEIKQKQEELQKL